MKSGRDTIADYFSQKLLILEQIDSLEVDDFEVGELPSGNTYGTVSAVVSLMANCFLLKVY